MRCATSGSTPSASWRPTLNPFSAAKRIPHYFQVFCPQQGVCSSEGVSTCLVGFTQPVASFLSQHDPLSYTFLDSRRLAACPGHFHKNVADTDERAAQRAAGLRHLAPNPRRASQIAAGGSIISPRERGTWSRLGCCHRGTIFGSGGDGSGSRRGGDDY